eukprot:SAG11_NODE_30_length_23132_cov_22.413277_10_plen_206_part_00
MIQKAVFRMKELQALVVAAKKAQTDAEQAGAHLRDERAQLDSKVKSLEAKLKFKIGVKRASSAALDPSGVGGPSGGGGSGDGDGDGGAGGEGAGGVVASIEGEKMIGALETQIQQLREQLRIAGNGNGGGEAAAASSAELQAKIAELNGELATAKAGVESLEASDAGEGSADGMIARLDEQQRELETTQQGVLLVSRCLASPRLA